jgi:sugar-specific transcriptional regulator TrmB
MNSDEVLRKLGLTPNEARIYTHLLNSQKDQPASEVIKILKMDKVSAYRSLKSLQHQGLVSAFGETRNQRFKVASSKNLFAKYNDQLSSLTSLRDQLEDLVQAATTKQHEFYQNNNISVYKGIEGYKQWNAERIGPGVSEIFEFTSGRIIEGMFGDAAEQQDYMQQYIQERVSKKISIKSLMSDIIAREHYDVTNHEILKQQRVIHLQEEMEGFMTTFGENFAFYTKQADEYIGVIVRDPILTKMMTVTLSLLWDQGEEV